MHPLPVDPSVNARTIHIRAALRDTHFDARFVC